MDQLEAAVGILRQHVAVAAGQDTGAGIALAYDAGELDAVHPGMMTSENTRSAENSSSAGSPAQHPRWRHADRVSEIFQELGGELSDVVIVLDHEDAVAAAAAAGSLPVRGGPRRHRPHRGLRQVDRKRRALAGVARDRDIAVGLLGKAECLAEAEAVPLPTSLVVKNGSKIVSSRAGSMPVPCRSR